MGVPKWTSFCRSHANRQFRGLEAAALSSPEIGMTSARGIKVAFELSWQELSKASQQLGDLLSLFAPFPIPWILVEQIMNDQKEDRLEDSRTELENLHLLKGTNPYHFHDLIREFFRTKLEQSPHVNKYKRDFSKVMVTVAQSVSRSLTLADIEQLTHVISHLAEVATHLIRWVDDTDLIWLFVGLARFYEAQGAVSQAEPWYEECLSICRDRLGEEHPDVATSLNNLAGLYASQGRYSEAEPLYEQALEQNKRLQV